MEEQTETDSKAIPPPKPPEVLSNEEDSILAFPTC
jgi:hypothetical protein